MIDQVADAFERKDYRTAARLLKQLVQQEPKNPLVRLYLGRLHEVTGKLEAAERVYRELLRDTTNSKVMSQARHGLSRVEAMEQERRRQALAQATADPSHSEFGFLILEPISAQAKQVAAQKFARIIQIDAYSARLQLPTRGWRLYRTGPIGELNFYVSSLQQAEIPCFAASLADILKIHVFNVCHFAEGSHASQATVVCHNEDGQLGTLTFNWSEVAQRVEGLLPIFEEVVDLDARRNIQRKTRTLDYLQICDLHLPGRNSILRLCDQIYQFQEGITFIPTQENAQHHQPHESHLHQATTRRNWNNLIDFLKRQLPQTKLWSDFTSFGDTAIDFDEMLGRLPSHVELLRRHETTWDPAFQLYSGLIFLRGSGK